MYYKSFFFRDMAPRHLLQYKMFWWQSFAIGLLLAKDYVTRKVYWSARITTYSKET